MNSCSGRDKGNIQYKPWQPGKDIVSKILSTVKDYCSPRSLYLHEYLSGGRKKY